MRRHGRSRAATRLGSVPTGGETLGAGAGRGEPGSGTPGDSGDLGGGGAEGTMHGSASPAATAGPESPSGSGSKVTS
jgi:hypothetical protein